MVRPGRAGARTPIGRDEGLGRPGNTAARQLALGLRVMRRDRTRLLAIGGGIGRIQGAHDRRRRRCLARTARGHQGRGATRDVLAVHTVCEPRAHRGTRSIVGRLPGSALHPAGAYGGTAATMGVVGVRLSRRALRDALGEEGAPRRVARGLRARIPDRRCKTRGQPHLPIHTAEHEGPTVCGQGAPVDIGPEGLPGERRHTALFGATIGHQQTSCRLSGMEGARLLCSQRLTRGLSMFMKYPG